MPSATTARTGERPLDHKLLLKTLMAMRRGDFSVRLPIDQTGVAGKVYDTLNDIIDLNQRMADEFERVSTVVGKDGKITQRAVLGGAVGAWAGTIGSVNSLIADLVQPTTEVGRVIGAVAKGDLSHSMAEQIEGRPLDGEFLRTARIVNTMVDQLRSFASEVTRVAREVGTEGKLGGQAEVKGLSGTWKDLTDSVNSMASNLIGQVRNIAEVTKAVAAGDLSKKITVDVKGEILELKNTINTMVDQLNSFAYEVTRLKDDVNQMIANLRDTTQKNTEQDWLKTNLAKFTRMLQGQRDLEAVARLILRDLAPLVRAQQGVFYIMDQSEAVNGAGGTLRLLSSYAYRERKNLSNAFRLGEGLVGQCALEKDRILLTEVPEDYIKISSGLGEAKPLNIVVLPVVFEGQVKAVVELASFYRFGDIHLTFLDQLTESIGIIINTIAAGMRTEELLKQSQSLAEELRSQQLELTETNRRLEQQALSLQASEDRLKLQQEELQQTNEELEERSELLQLQNAEVERKNREIEQAKIELEGRAQQLALSSKYKSEFLANMSHELRTPLNSLLILAKLLSDNPKGNLDDKQVEFARTIHSAGSDLLSLINDILDLSKIESGTMAIDVDELELTVLQDYVERNFLQMAQGKGLEFTVEIDTNAPDVIYTDPRRLQQVLKNLLSNAFKFTDRGGVSLRMSLATEGWGPDSEILDRASAVLAFSVTDSGIGIPQHKQKIIFEAFQQADGTTSRKYGGTGLGLSISREIARLLGGEIRVRSTHGSGSTFTLYVPQTHAPALGTSTLAPTFAAPRSLPQAEHVEVELSHVPTGAASFAAEVDDDRDDIQPGDRVLLIIEDDVSFASVLLAMAREKGFKALIALRGDTGLALARECKPDAITLDLRLPVVDGWTVLDRLKHDARTRHIPVHLISGSEIDARSRALKQGALAFLQKPVSSEALAEALGVVKGFVERRVKNLLIVEDDETQRKVLVELIGNGDVVSTAVGSAEECLELLRSQHFDCMVLDLGLPEMTGFDLINVIKSDEKLRELPIIVYTGKDLTQEEETRLKRVTDAIIVKSVRSMEHLLDETALFLHRVEANLPQAKQQMLKQVHQADPVFSGKKVLIIDDDVRNIFAITSVLERHHMSVVYAENGRSGIEMLHANPDVNVVLMDVMMPEMDGYETSREIRKEARFTTLPIIALTAKAMKGDREKCLEAGASDYITKPVEPEQLLSLLRVWLYG
jgi:CheY-like chemotaxis protein/HAMP domain-containing protein